MHETTAVRATEFGALGLAISIAVFVAGIVVGEGMLGTTAATPVVVVAFFAGSTALLVALGSVLYLADVAAIVVARHTTRRR